MASAIAVALGCAFVTGGVIIPPGRLQWPREPGAGGVAVESNMLSSILSGKVNVGNKKLITCPTRPTTARWRIPVLNFELSYTFASTRTQLHIGNLLEDYLRFDTTTVAGAPGYRQRRPDRRQRADDQHRHPGVE